MIRMQPVAYSTLVGLALMLGSVTLVQASGEGVPNCAMRVPCPPPTNHSAVGVAESAQPVDIDHSIARGPNGPNCLAASCPPPPNA